MAAAGIATLGKENAMPSDKKKETARIAKSSECGATHSDCPNSWQGCCDREVGHDGSHHCDKCNSLF